MYIVVQFQQFLFAAKEVKFSTINKLNLGLGWRAGRVIGSNFRATTQTNTDKPSNKV
jgi:hypothetical protein